MYYELDFSLTNRHEIVLDVCRGRKWNTVLHTSTEPMFVYAGLLPLHLQRPYYNPRLLRNPYMHGVWRL